MLILIDRRTLTAAHMLHAFPRYTFEQYTLAAALAGELTLVREG